MTSFVEIGHFSATPTKL